MLDENQIPEFLEASFESAVSQYRGALAPGAEARLRRQTLEAYHRKKMRGRGDVESSLIAFLEGQDHREAALEGDQEKMRMTDPSPFFLPDKQPAPDVPIRAVLKRLGGLKPGAAAEREGELADSLFGLGHREAARVVVRHLQERENHRHLARPPAMGSPHVMEHKAR